MISRLTVLYDERCALCVRCRDWMLSQDALVPLDFLASHSIRAVQLYGRVIPWLGDELVVVGDGGEVWVGPAAFLVCLWALADYREWSHRLAGDTFSKVAVKFFATLSKKRRWIAEWLEHPGCSDERCRIAHAAPPYR
jgi:predicted DCC family thiol-disulfide oxidoreductase YuxK